MSVLPGVRLDVMRPYGKALRAVLGTVSRRTSVLRHTQHNVDLSTMSSG